MVSSSFADPVVVVGGGLAGMAAAARLAKAGHRVQLLEADDRLGGGWAARQVDGVLVDAAPGVLGFPAPWRDLFRKSGRPLEAELARMGVGLTPAPAPRYLFADGSELVLPSERGEQFATLAAAYGTAAAVRWRDLVDGLEPVWQTVRPLGLEAELRDRRQLTAARRTLRPRQMLDRLARQLEEPHLAAIVASLAYRLGSVPERTPAWCAVELFVERTFGRWMVTSDQPADRTGRSSVLVEALAQRLILRKVDVQLGQRVTRLTVRDGRATGVLTVSGEQRGAAAVVCTVDPWQTYTELLEGGPDRGRRRTLARWRPALAPVVSSELVAATPGRGGDVDQTVELTAPGVPTVTYRRPTGSGIVLTRHDYRVAAPRRSAGIAWDGRRWPDRPAVTSEVPGLFLAGPFSPGGATPSAVVLSGALASYACHGYLS